MHVPDAVARLESDLRLVFGDRLRSLVVYEAIPRAGAPPPRTPTMAIVQGLSAADLDACTARVASWREAGLATPLFLTADEFARALDAFPLEFGAIVARHQVVAGENPFEGLHVQPEHLRVACEVQARSHLLHLREDYLETEGRGSAVADLIEESAAPLAMLVASVARLEGASAAPIEAAAAHLERSLGLPDDVLSRIVGLGAGPRLSSETARQLWPRYLTAIERLTQHIDRWGSSR